MTTQEILASLSQLEQELQSIKSARALVDKTVDSYAEVRKDITRLLDEFTSVTKSLNDISSAFESENAILTSEIQKAIDVVRGQLDTLNTAFANQCNNTVMRFMENVGKAADELCAKTETLSSSYQKNNDDFEASITELAKVHASLISATESVASLKSDIANLQTQLNESQKNQDGTLNRIAAQLEATGSKHAEILSQIASELKTSQDAQDSDLMDIKNAQTEHASKLDAAAEAISSNGTHLNKVLSALSEVSSMIGNRMDAIEKKLENQMSAVKTNKTMVIINIVATIVAIILLLLK